MTNNRIETIKKEITKLRKERQKNIKKLLSPKSMVIGTFYEVYKTCSKPNCCCQHGKKHGPFPALSMSVNGKRKLKMVKRVDEMVVKKKARAYQNYQQTLASVRKINKKIDGLLEEIKEKFIEEYI